MGDLSPHNPDFKPGKSNGNSCSGTWWRLEVRARLRAASGVFLWKTTCERDLSSPLAEQQHRCYSKLPSRIPGRALRARISSSAAVSLTTSPRRPQADREQEAQHSSPSLQWSNYSQASFLTKVVRVLSSLLGQLWMLDEWGPSRGWKSGLHLSHEGPEWADHTAAKSLRSWDAPSLVSLRPNKCSPKGGCNKSGLAYKWRPSGRGDGTR